VCDHWQRRAAPNLKSIILPAYSPELNPVEKFWDIVKDRICNTAWPTLEAFQEKITVTLRNIGNIPAESCLFSNIYLRSELNGSKNCPCLFH
jgi:hypothetical protein